MDGRGVGEDLRQPVHHGRLGIHPAGELGPQDVDPALDQTAYVTEVRLVALGVTAEGAQIRKPQPAEFGLRAHGGQSVDRTAPGLPGHGHRSGQVHGWRGGHSDGPLHGRPQAGCGTCHWYGPG